MRQVGADEARRYAASAYRPSWGVIYTASLFSI